MTNLGSATGKVAFVNELVSGLIFQIPEHPCMKSSFEIVFYP